MSPEKFLVRASGRWGVRDGTLLTAAPTHQKQQNAELANGRLAMIGIAGSYSAELLPHSIPFIP